MLDLIEPARILICTDGSKFGHPDADALEKVRTHDPDAPIHFTDSTEIIATFDLTGAELGLSGDRLALSDVFSQLPVALLEGA